MNILAPVRRDRVLAELPQVGTRATSGLWLLLSVGGEKVAPEQLDWAQPCRPQGPLLLGGPLPTPPPTQGCLAITQKLHSHHVPLSA